MRFSSGRSSFGRRTRSGPYADTLAFSDALVGTPRPVSWRRQSPHARARRLQPPLPRSRTASRSWAPTFSRASSVSVDRRPLLPALRSRTRRGSLRRTVTCTCSRAGAFRLRCFSSLRGYRQRSAWLVLGGWLVAAWQMTLGFTLGLQFAYLLAVLGAIAVVALVRWRASAARRGASWSRPLSGCSCSPVSAGLSWPGRTFVSSTNHPEARRTPAYVETFSPELRSFLAAPAQSWLWADPSQRARAPLPAPGRDVSLPWADDFATRPPRSARFRLLQAPTVRARCRRRNLCRPLTGST